jgi:transcriptional regulator with XRE-family HTH domain
MEKIREVVAFNLKRIRAEKGISQTKVAQECNFEIPSFSRWENGKAWPSPETIQELAKYYEVSPTEFYRPKKERECTLTEALKAVEEHFGVKIEILAQKRKPKKS